MASGAISGCCRTYLGSVCNPKSLAEFEPVCIALWNNLGQAMVWVMEEHKGEVTSPAPTTKGCGIPSIIAPGQKESEQLCPTERILPDEVYEVLPSAWVRDMVSHGIGRCPSDVPFGA